MDEATDADASSLQSRSFELFFSLETAARASVVLLAGDELTKLLVKAWNDATAAMAAQQCECVRLRDRLRAVQLDAKATAALDSVRQSREQANERQLVATIARLKQQIQRLEVNFQSAADETRRQHEEELDEVERFCALEIETRSCASGTTSSQAGDARRNTKRCTVTGSSFYVRLLVAPDKWEGCRCEVERSEVRLMGEKRTVVHQLHNLVSLKFGTSGELFTILAKFRPDDVVAVAFDNREDRARWARAARGIARSDSRLSARVHPHCHREDRIAVLSKVQALASAIVK